MFNICQAIEDLSLRDFTLGLNHNAYYYEGSYTTPDCEENVGWIVLNNPIECTTTQIELFTQRQNNNYRSTMDIGDRDVQIFIIAKLDSASSLSLSFFVMLSLLLFFL
jgi:carbonic anhydrase